jgi:hypothetical protein
LHSGEREVLDREEENEEYNYRKSEKDETKGEINGSEREIREEGKRKHDE